MPKQMHEVVSRILVSAGDEQLIYYPEFFNHTYFDLLKKEVVWQQNDIRIFGKTHLEPRLTAWFGKAYAYSGIHWAEQEMIPIVSNIHDEVEQRLGITMNSVLLNYYRSGADSMGWHRDNEKNLDTTLIVSASFGIARKFVVKHRTTGEKHEVVLEDRSLLLMKNFQNNWLHALPKSKRVSKGRINLTFRHIIS